MAVKQKAALIAYMADGTPVKYNHAVDYRSALAAGLSSNPPGVHASKKKMPAVPEGEKATGIEPLSAAEPEKSEPTQTAGKPARIARK